MDEYEFIKVVSDREVIVDGDITSELCSELCIALRDLEVKMLSISSQYRMATPPEIVLRIKTWGGDLHSSLAVVDLIKALRVPLIVEINGYAASAGSLISSAAETVIMNPSAFMLVHQLSTTVSGTRSEVSDYHKQIEQSHEVMIDVYKSKTGLTRKRIKKILARESWMNATKAVELGFADEIGVV